MSIESILESQGEYWEVRRGGHVVGTFRGFRNTKLQNVGFLPDADIRDGDDITGSVCKKTHRVAETDLEVHDGEPFCLYAKYGEPAGRRVGHTINIGTAVGSAFMLDSPGVTQNVTFTSDSAADLKAIVRGLLAEIDDLGLSEGDKKEVKENAEHLKKRLEVEKPEPGLIRATLAGIKKKLVEAAAAAAASRIVTQAQQYAGLITDFLQKHFPN